MPTSASVTPITERLLLMRLQFPVGLLIQAAFSFTTCITKTAAL